MARGHADRSAVCRLRGHGEIDGRMGRRADFGSRATWAGVAARAGRGEERPAGSARCRYSTAIGAAMKRGKVVRSAVLLLCMLAGGIAAADAQTSSTPGPSDAHAHARHGHELFLQNGCYLCHGTV